MIQRIIEKRTSESWRFDFDCSSILSQTERVMAVLSVSCDEEDVELQFGTPAINDNQVFYSDGVLANIGQVIQVPIAGGVIPDGVDSMGYGLPNILCTIRVAFATTLADHGEATALLLLKNGILQ